jgi:hypothetical protein
VRIALGESSDPMRVSAKNRSASRGERFAVQRKVVDMKSRIQRSLKAFNRHGPIAISAELERGDRTISEWRLALLRLGSGATADMRSAAIAPEDLVEVACDPAADAKDRVLAAIGVSKSLTDETRAMLADAARDAISDQLRSSLQAIIDDDAFDDDIEAVLRSLSGDDSEAGDVKASEARERVRVDEGAGAGEDDQEDDASEQVGRRRF